MTARVPTSEPPFFSFSPVKTAICSELVEINHPPAKVVTVTAPTGYGKSVFLASLFQHYRRGGADCRWLSLEVRDASVERLLTHLEALLAAPRSEVDVYQALHQGDEPVDDRIAALLQSIAVLSGPVVLFVDNLNCCTDETLEYVLDALIFGTPSWIHLVIASSGSIPFNQARAKLEGRLRHIGFAELSLNIEEVRRLLGAQLCDRLSASAVETIASQSEGWPAAVRLMQIVLAAAERPEEALSRFSGADEDLAALLNRQVLQGFDQRSRQFLLEISLLRTFGINLCRQATGDERAAEFVDQLLRQNVFVIPLDRNRSWYRLHALFREFLVDEAHRQISPERRREILSRAAEWCEHAGLWQDAIDYALEAESSSLATAILERVAAMFVRDRGDLHQYIEWVEKLHASGISCGWEADFWYVWALVFHRRYEYARQQLERLSRRPQDEADSRDRPGNTAAFRRRIEVIRIVINTYTDYLPEAYSQAVKWLDGLSDDDPFNVATIACAAGIHLTSAFEFVEARKMMRVAQSYIAQARSDYGTAWVTLLSAMAALYDGDFVHAHQDLLAGLRRARANLGEAAGIVGTIALLAAKSAAEMNLDLEAGELLAQGLRKFQSHGLVDTAAFGLEAAVKLWKGRPDDVISIAEMRELAAAYPPRLALMLSCFLIRRLLRLGKAEEALAEAAQIGLSMDRGTGMQMPGPGHESASSRDLWTAAAIEIAVVSGKMKQAAALVAEQTKLARADGRWARLVELALDEAAISLCTHNPAPAARHLSRAVTLAARRRYIRPFRDRAELVAGLVNETRSKDWGFVQEEERLFFSEICRDLPVTNGTLLGQLEDMNVVPALSQTPTARELELLTLVEAGLSNQQLADRLSVSVATVKWHLYNLYAKLGVSSRSAALSRARALNLLSR
jgi:LuxR family maltose regulon positive regulatory protein